jgi:Zn-dependent protease with chaperone function
MPRIDPATLDARNLGHYRHPREWLALFGAVAFFAVVVVVVDLSKVALADLGLTAVFSAWLLDILTSMLSKPWHRAGAIEITATQLAELHPIVEELRQRFDLPRVHVLVSQESGLPYGAHGLTAPYSILLNAVEVNLLEEDELRYVLGRELGAIRLGHTRLAIFFGGQQTHPLPAALSFLLLPRNLAFGWWYRAAEYSRDRAGVVACRSMRTAFSAMIKVSQRNLASRVTIDALDAQLAAVNQDLWRWGAAAITTTLSRPPLMLRLCRLVEWAGPPAPPAPVDPAEA